jgi:hypothetical protein
MLFPSHPYWAIGASTSGGPGCVFFACEKESTEEISFLGFGGV